MKSVPSLIMRQPWSQVLSVPFFFFTFTARSTLPTHFCLCTRSAFPK